MPFGGSRSGSTSASTHWPSSMTTLANEQKSHMNAPEVLVLPETAIRAALHRPEFQPGPTITAEASKRALSYNHESRRRAAEADLPSSTSPEELLRSLGLRLELRRATPEELPRVAELCQRTNQLNATLARTEAADLRRYLSAPESIDIRVAYLEDRFGDYGLIGTAVIEPAQSGHRLREFAFSCRAMGRQVELAMLSYIGSLLAAQGSELLTIEFLPTERNDQLLKILGEAGFTACGQPQADGTEPLALRVNHAVVPPSWLEVHTDLDGHRR